MSTLTMVWDGVYTWFGQKCFFSQPKTLLNKGGVYLWTNPRHLTYYVGETNHFLARYRDHLEGYLSGYYRLYDPQKFANGEMVLLWGGRWKRDRQSPKYIAEFMREYDKWAQIIWKFLGELRIFLSPIEVDKHTRERIEAGIVEHLQSQGKLTMEQDSINATLRKGKRRENEAEIHVSMANDKGILGLPKALMV